MKPAIQIAGSENARRRCGLLVSLCCLAFLWLLSPCVATESEKQQEIARLSRLMDWRAGQTIADVGAGEGEFGFAAAGIVGESGRVYLTELDDKKFESLGQEVKRRATGNIVVLKAREKETNLPEASCDGMILRRVYHHLTAPKEMDASMLRSLKPGGLLAVIEFPPRKWLSLSDPVKGVPANRGGHGIPQKILIQELTAAGFVVDKTVNDWPEDSYCVLFRKPLQ